MKPFSYEVFRDVKGKELRNTFPGWFDIEKNYSECLQDIFVLMATNGKKNGSYVEIGCDQPYHRSNTAILQEHEWVGVSFDINKAAVDDWNEKRGKFNIKAPVGGRNRAYACDATTIYLPTFLSQHSIGRDIDYLQLDIDPPDLTYQAMHRIPWDYHRFAVITYEHDSYFYPDKDYRSLSREFLTKKGYVLVAPNISPDEDRTRAFEDWWVHPELIEPDVLEKIKSLSDEHKTPMDYLLGKV